MKNATGTNRSRLLVAALGVPLLAGFAATPAAATEPRVLGLDVSAWQGDISQTTWNNIRNVENRQFVFIRSSRGGTTGFYNQSDPSNNLGQNTLSQRYDDPYYVQNITRATNAGMFAGSYHFSRPDIIESTLNSGGIRNTGADEADHFIQMAGAWMRPGYLLPVHDLEAGQSQRSRNELAQFAIDFSNRIHEVMGIRPAIYINGNYTNYLDGASTSLRNQIAPAYPTLWNARWPNQSDPDSIPVHTGHPKDTYSGFYGPWDDPPATTHPWAFWQYASTGRLQSFNNGNSNLDLNVAHGDIEFLKDQLVPAVWMHNGSGDWSDLANWNSGQDPIVPEQGEGQVPRVGPLTLPTPRVPGHDDTLRNVHGQNDTVILDRPSANITVTHSSGTHNIRKLIVRETLDITGGMLNIHYVPPATDPPNYAPLDPFSARFSGAVTLGGSGSLSAHTIQVDPFRTFTLAGGTLTVDSIDLMPHSSVPSRIQVTGDVTLNPLGNATATIARGAGTGNTGSIDLAGGNRVISVGDGPAAVDVSIHVPITNGALTKAGPGTMRLPVSSTYSSGTTVNEGTLLVTNTTGSATGSGDVTVNGGTLAGTGSIAGSVNVAGGTVAPGMPAGIVAEGPRAGRLTAGRLDMTDGSLAIKIGGATPGTGHDQLEITGNATLAGGNLSLSRINDFYPAMGDEFTILTADTVTGRFGSVSGHEFAPMAWLATVYEPSAVRLVMAIPGDTNLDGVVSIADLGILATNWQASGKSWTDGDFTGTGTVDIADLGILASNWQNGTDGASSVSFAEAMAMFDVFDGVVVPEPSAAAGVLGLGLLALRRRRF